MIYTYLHIFHERFSIQDQLVSNVMKLTALECGLDVLIAFFYLYFFYFECTFLCYFICVFFLSFVSCVSLLVLNKCFIYPSILSIPNSQKLQQMLFKLNYVSTLHNVNFYTKEFRSGSNIQN